MKRICFIFLCLWVGMFLRAEVTFPAFSFSSLRVERGLSQLSVTSIHQDHKGYMWFGTRNGLNRYDGNVFVVYKHINGDSLSLSENHVTALAEDEGGNLWIGTRNGLNRLDLKTNRIYSFNDRAAYATSPIRRAWISCLYIDRKRRIWVGTDNGLLLYEEAGGRFLPVDMGGVLPHGQVMSLGEDHAGNLLVGTYENGLYICDDEQRLVAHYSHDETASSLTDNVVSALLEYPEGVLWVGTRLKGLNRIDREKGTVESYTVENGRLGNNAVRTLEVYDSCLVVGTYNGLTLVDPMSGKSETYTNFDWRQGGLSHFSVFSTCVDRANTFWVGTYAGGVSYSHPINGRFRYYDQRVFADNHFGILATMAYQPDHTLWIASEGRGLLALDLESERFERYLLDDRPDALNDRNIIKSLLLEGDCLWCGTQKGTLYRFDTRTRRFSLFYSFQKDVSIYTIARGSDGALLVGTTDNVGLTRLLPDGTVAPPDTVFRRIPSVRSFLELRAGVYLVGTHTTGLVRYDSHTGNLTFYNTREEGDRRLLNDQVTNIVRDAKGRIWIGTFGGGLCRYDEAEGITERLTTVDGLSDDNVNSILPTSDGKLWISTGNGISAYDPESHTFINYTGKSEIPINEFSLKGGILLPDGRVFFSGSNGLIAFYPERLRANRFIPPVVLTSFTINNKPVVPGDASGVLDKVLDYTSEIELDYGQNNFSIGYAALNYLYPNQNQYAYKLEGYDDDWN